ncbi:radical SAM protein [bacterium]|nr:radical SAM protein [bacterium]
MLFRYLSFASKIFAANRRQLSKPFKLTYVVTKECHSKCLNCDIWKVKPQHELTLEEAKQVARKNPYFSWIDFTGGEPTDREDFVDLVDTFNRNQPKLLLIHFVTNGLKPKRIVEMTKELLGRGLPRLTVSVSIDGPPAVNDQLRGIPKDFERATETLRLLRQLKGLDVYAGMTLYAANTELVFATVSAISEVVPGFTLEDLHVNIPHISGHFYGNNDRVLTVTEQMTRAINDLERVRKFRISPLRIVEGIYRKKINNYLQTKECPEDCAALMSSVILSETGVIYPCLMWDEPLGNVRDTDYDILPHLRSGRARDLREKLLKKDCANCWTPCEAFPTILSNCLRINQR